MACQAGDTSSAPGLGRSPQEGNGNPLQYSCLGNPMDKEAWWATIHGVTKELDTTERLNNNSNITHLIHDTLIQMALYKCKNHACRMVFLSLKLVRKHLQETCLELLFANRVQSTLRLWSLLMFITAQ